MRAALFLLLFGCLGFGWWQNHGASIGGAISLAKILWLNLALACFFLIPAVLWRDPRAGDRTRLVYGLFLGSFLLRALIEAPMLYVWQNWRCGYGITHDLVMIVLIIAGISPPRFATFPDSDASARRFGFLLLITLACEALNAWLFSRVADPRQGIYFASTEAGFATINRITWMEISLLYPAIVWWAWRHPRR
jgi:hypothetical protein